MNTWRPLLTPAQLPPCGAFVHRNRELQTLENHRHTTQPGPTVSCITGIAGAGKTQLALDWAHSIRDEYPDGQLYCNLHGFDQHSPVDPATVLDVFLWALDAPQDCIPERLDERTELFQLLLEHKRMLIMLDNAHDVEQIRPLLPRTDGSLTVVTSRSPLPSMAQHDNTQLLPLRGMTTDEARELLAEWIGWDRLDAELDAVADLLNRCHGLPLALAIVAAQLSEHAWYSLADWADRMRRNPIETLSLYPDSLCNLRVIFSWSLRELDTVTTRLFRLLAAERSTVTAHTAADLANLPTEACQQLLTELANRGLVEHTTPGLYRIPELLRAYSRELDNDTQP